MRTTIFAALFVIAVTIAAARAQDSGPSQTQGMMQGMAEQKSGDSGMQGMGGMMGMMKMMDQCNAMMADHKNGSALDILKKRYAKGEIGKDEFERMKKDVE